MQQILIMTFLIGTMITNNSFASSPMMQSLVPSVKKIIIQKVQSETSASEAYKRIQQMAQDAIDFQTRPESRELLELFSEIESELSYHYIKLNKEQMVSLIIKAINS